MRNDKFGKYDPNWIEREKQKQEVKRKEEQERLEFPKKVEEFKQLINDSGLVGQIVNDSGISFLLAGTTTWEVPQFKNRVTVDWSYYGLNNDKNYQWVARFSESPMSIHGRVKPEFLDQFKMLFKIFKDFKKESIFKFRKIYNKIV